MIKNTMKTMKKPALLAAAILAATTIPATAANLLAYYPVDSFYNTGTYGVSGNVTRTVNLVAGWGDGTLNYSGGALYQNDIYTPGQVGAGAFRELGVQGRLTLSTADPFAATGSFTYALWMYTPTTFTGGAQTFILSKFNANTAAGLDFKLMLRPADIQLMTWNGTAVSTVQTTSTMTSGNGWNHYAITATKSGSTVTWGVYENGSPITFNGGVNSAGISSSANGLGMTIGQSIGTQQFGFNGVMADDIRFYDGILSQAEIVALIPEPSAFAMIALGGLMLFLRRRC